jgi:hypothetical protein
VSIKEKRKTKTAVSEAAVGEIKAQSVFSNIMHGHGASTVQAIFAKKNSLGVYTV